MRRSAGLRFGLLALAGACSATPVEPQRSVTPATTASAIAPAATTAAPAAQRFADSEAPRPRDPQRAARLAGVFAEVDKLFRGAVDRGAIVGLAAGVVVDGELAWSQGYGTREIGKSAPITTDTVFRIGSITKTMTGVALLKLRDDDKLAFDDPAVRHVSELAGVIYPTRDSPLITVRHLVTHTSGLVRHGPLASIIRAGHTPTEAELAGLLKDMKLEAPPGARREYSNFGAALAGLVVSRAAGMPYREYVTKTLLSPLGMASSTWDPDPKQKDLTAVGHQKRGPDWTASTTGEVLGAAEPAGGLYSTLADMGRYAAFQLAAWPARDDPDTGPVRRSSLRESHQTQGFQTAGSSGKGVFWSVIDDCRMGHLVFHNGGMSEGFKSTMYFLPQSGLAIIALSNGLDDSAKVDLDDVGKEALQRIAEADTKNIPGIEEAAVTIKSLLAKPDPAALEKAFAPSWSDKLVSLREFLVSVASSSGACTTHRWLRSRGPRNSVAELTCDKRTVEVSLTVSKDDPKRIGSFSAILRPRCE